MKKIISVLTILGVLLVNAIPTLAAQNEFDLIEYVENNKIETYSEFLEVISENTSCNPQSTYTHSLIAISDKNEEYFNVEIDYENNTVEVDVIYSEISNAETMASTRSGSAKHETYSSIGALNYIVTVNGSFSYTSTSCSTVSKSGSFESATASFWSSTPSITSGNITTSKAYARTAGTARFLLTTQTYQLTLMCDTSGILTSTFSRP